MWSVLDLQEETLFSSQGFYVKYGGLALKAGPNLMREINLDQFLKFAFFTFGEARVEGIEYW